MRPIRPFFKEGDMTIYNGDCLEVLSNLNLGSKVLLFTDPPYGIGENGGKSSRNRSSMVKVNSGYEHKYSEKEWDNQPPPPEYFKYILKNTKDQIIFGGNYFTDWLHNTPCFLVWDKKNSGDFADCEIAWTSFKTAIRKFEWRWNGCMQQTSYGKGKETRIHPTQKPVELAKMILKKYYDKEKYNVVLDTHMGSGSFGVACKELGIPYIGIDQDLEYCEGARFRLASLKAVSELTTEKKGMFY